MNHVKVRIGATASKYWACLETEKDGTTYEKMIEKEHEGSVHSNLIRAVIDAFRALNRPCMVDIYTRSEYIVEPFKNGWINNWEKHEWKNAKGREVRNAELWKELRRAAAPHSARYLYEEDKR